MSFKKTEQQPVTELIATFRTSRQIGPEDWEVFPVSKSFTPDTTLAEVCEWFFREEHNAIRMQAVTVGQPEALGEQPTAVVSKQTEGL